ncbi:MAG TPA: NUDIX hydrolase [Pseudolabrys sp.]|uniref:NUDIX hydrolase n=1 Tax=Pseudolabrys sp. TaxID=1960880 RepID=UPI002DDCF764|nr:NUDIX hydrolase [Pseudolabrys sp.]HEV2627125.1 NUDIX hydrolase [Pseudolabrys sp.]
MDEIADRAADVAFDEPELLAKGYRAYRRYRVTLTGEDGATIEQERDVLDGGKVIAVLPVDVERDEIVLIRQFRLPAHLGNGKGDLVEIVAGRVEQGETLAASARRECREEIGLAPSALVELFSYFTTPGLTDETVTVFLAAIDAAQVPAHTRLGDEYIRTLRVPIDAALTALQTNTIHNGPAIMALQWLALNRARLAELLRR